MLTFDFGEDPYDSMSTTIVSCTISKGDLPIDINWFFNGYRLSSNDGILITKSGQKATILNIESIQPRHAGNYTCFAKNKAGEAQHTSELKVIGKLGAKTTILQAFCFECFISYFIVIFTKFYPVQPSIMPFTFGDEILNSGESTAIQCMVFKGDSPIMIEWYFNSRLLKSVENGIVITRMTERLSTLSIDPISYKHKGVYECRAKNNAGEFSYQNELKINGIF